MSEQKISPELSVDEIANSTKEWKEKEFDSEAAEHAFDHLGFTFIGSGIARMAYLYKDGKVVLKVQKINDTFCNRPHNQNEWEVKNSETLPESIKKFILLPIAHAKDFSWILMPKAETYKELGHDEMITIKDFLKKALKREGFYYGDFITGNVGKFNGQPVLIDYGFSFDRVEKSSGNVS